METKIIRSSAGRLAEFTIRLRNEFNSIGDFQHSRHVYSLFFFFFFLFRNKSTGEGIRKNIIRHGNPDFHGSRI